MAMNEHSNPDTGVFLLTYTIVSVKELHAQSCTGNSSSDLRMRSTVPHIRFSVTSMWCSVHMHVVQCIHTCGAVYTCTWCSAYMHVVQCIHTCGAVYTCMWCSVYMHLYQYYCSYSLL